MTTGTNALITPAAVEIPPTLTSSHADSVGACRPPTLADDGGVDPCKYELCGPKHVVQRILATHRDARWPTRKHLKQILFLKQTSVRSSTSIAANVMQSVNPCALLHSIQYNSLLNSRFFDFISVISWSSAGGIRVAFATEFASTLLLAPEYASEPQFPLWLYRLLLPIYVVDAFLR